MLGDVLKKEMYRLKNCSTKKNGKDAFWIVLRDIAVKEIIEYGYPIDSNVIIEAYYDILSSNLQFIPEYFQQTLKSNKQERFRVINRNLFSSNSFHPDGLANQPGIKAIKRVNPDKKGYKVIYERGNKDVIK